MATKKSVITHAEGVEIGRRWLIRNKCVVTLNETVGMASRESPDGLGWLYDGQTVLIEVKVSRADFLSDKGKTFRKFPEFGMGTYRYYLTPPGMIKTSELPVGWGLLETAGHSVSMVRRSSSFAPDRRAEAAHLVIACRHLAARNAGVVTCKAFTLESLQKSTISVDITPGELVEDAPVPTFVPDFPIGHDFYGRAFQAEPGFEVKPSPIEGLGVFATRDFTSGELLLHYGGKKVKRNTLETDLKKSIYVFDVGDGFVRDPLQGEHTVAILVNHKCSGVAGDSNCISVLDGDSIYFRATRDIKVGDELGYDYLVEFGHPLTREQWDWGACRCGSISCRGSMFSTDQMKNLAFDRNEGEAQ